MFEELKSFITVVELKNFTKAAEKLSLSQPSVSVHIKNLENHFGVKLIDRSVKQKSIAITDRGYLLYRRAKEIIELMDTTVQEVKNYSENISGSLRIGASLTIGEFLLPELIAYFSEKYPDVNIEVFIENTSKIANMVKNLSIDIGIIEGNISSSDFNQTFFYKDEMVLAFPYSEKNLIHKKDYRDLISGRKWVARESGSGTRDFLDMFLSQNKITPESITVLGSNFAVKEAVKNNMGITLLSKLICKRAERKEEIVCVSPDETYVRNFSYIVSKNITPSRAATVFIDELKSYSESLCI